MTKPPTESHGVLRRRLLMAGVAAGSFIAAPWPSARGQTASRSAPPASSSASGPVDHRPFGPVVPAAPLPSMTVQTHQGQAVDLRDLFRGRISAVQLMFTGCSATCPIQGAVFAAAQTESVRAKLGVQFVSISIDPLSDTPRALADWLKRQNAAPGWLAVVPRPNDVDALLTLLRGRAEGVDRHTAQSYIVGRRAELTYRSPEFWPPERLVELLKLTLESR